MNRKITIATRMVAVLALFLALALCAGAAADSYDANTMRLLRYEGSVEIYDPTGLPRFVLENVRFSSGESMETGVDSLASVGLDDTKIVTLDASTRVDFVQESGHILLNLKQGSIFLDVQEKLDENESLDIQTTTMTVGIRGTVIFVSEDVNASGSGRTTLEVFEGTAQVDCTDPSGAHRLIAVPAGQAITIESQPGANGEGTVITQQPVNAMNAFVTKLVMEDERLIKRVQEASPEGQALISGTTAPADQQEIPDGYPDDGNWTWDETVTLTAQSASKLYDGTPLSRPSDVLVSGLPVGLNIVVSARGSLTNAGSTANEIARYTIVNGNGEDVTDRFTSIKTVNGILRVDPVPVTVWTGSAKKYYDGEPLTCTDAGLEVNPAYEYGAVEWRNTSLVTRTALGSETMIAVSGTIWVHGSSPMTGKTEDIALLAGQRLSVRIDTVDGKNNITYEIVKLKPEELPEEVLRLYADNPELLEQACIDAEWDPEELRGLIANLKPVSAVTSKKNGLVVGNSVREDLMQDSANVRITIDTDLTQIRNRPLNGDEAHFTPIELEPTITVITTGSQTEVGESDNTYEIDWGGAIESNYVIEGEKLGKLTVLPVHDGRVTLTAASAGKVYDGEPLEDSTFGVDGLPSGYIATATVEGSLTEAGTAENKITSYKIHDMDGEDVTESFTNLETVSGTLTVEPLSLDLNVGGATASYNGDVYVPTPTLTYLNGDHVGETVNGTRTSNRAHPHVASSSPVGMRAASRGATFEFILFTNDKIEVTISGTGTGAGTYTLTAAVSVLSGSISDFALTFSETTLTIEPLELSITTPSASKPYDGSALTATDAVVTGLADGETITVNVTGTITDVGTVENTYTIDWGDTNSDNYTINHTLGTLEVTAYTMPVTITAATASQPYDGTTLTDSSYEVTGLPDGFTCEAVVTGSQHGLGTSDNTVESYFIYNTDNIDVTVAFTNVTTTNGTLTVTTNDTPITLTASSFTMAYNGQLRSGFGGVTVEGVPEAVQVTASTQWTAKNAGEYPLNVSYYMTDSEMTDDPADCFTNITVVNGTLTVTPIPLTITTPSLSKIYDGTPLTGGEATVTGLAGSDTITVTTSSLTNVGTAPNDYTIDWGTVSKDNYTVTDEIGTLEVTGVLTSVTFTAPSASKVFDGTALTAEEVTVSGLPDGYTFEAVATGTQTDVGSSSNLVGTYFIYKDGEDVTDNFLDISTVDGTLTVEPLEITFDMNAQSGVYGESSLGTGTRSQYYANGTHSGEGLEYISGSALQYGSVGLYRTFAGDSIALRVLDEPPRNVGDRTLNVSVWVESGNDANYTLSVINANYTISPAPLTITTGSASKIYDGTALTAPVTVTGLASSDESKVTITATGSITDVGSTPNTYTIDWGDVLSTNYTLTEEIGTLEVTGVLTPVTFTAPSASKVYDGTALTAEEVTASGLPDGYTFEAVATGTQTDAGSSANPVGTYFIYKGGEDVTSSFLNISTVDGTLTVEPLKIDFDMDGAVMARVYGQSAPERTRRASYLNGIHSGEEITDFELTGNAYGGAFGTEYSGSSSVYKYSLFTGDTVSLRVFGFGTLADNAGDHIIRSTATLSEGLDANYIITVSNTDFTITPAPVTITTGSASKAYDGTELTAPVTVTGLTSYDESKVTITATGTQTDVGSTANTYNLDWGDALSTNYTLTESIGTLTVEKVAVAIDIVDTEVTFNNGYNFVNVTVTCDTTFTSEFHGDQNYAVTLPGARVELTFNESAKRKSAGVSELTAEVSDWSYGNPDNFNVTISGGTLTVNPAPITITTGSAEKYYDGTPLTSNEFTVTGFPSGEVINISTTGSITDIGSTSNTYVINSWNGWEPGNYKITDDLGTLTILEPGIITVTTGSANRTYNGEALTSSEASISGLLPEDEGKVTVTATGSITDVGTAQNTYIIDWGTVDNTSYTIKEELGTLTVEKMAVDIDIVDTEVTFNNGYNFVDVAVTSDATLSSEFLGNTYYAVNLPGARMRLAFNTSAKRKSAGTTELTAEIDEWTYGNPDNFNVTISGGTLTVKPAPITITTGSATKVYDGQPLTSDDYTVTGFPSGEAINISTTGSITKVGSISNTYVINSWNGWEPGNYEITDNLGTLTVEELQLNFTISDNEYTYTTSVGAVPYAAVTLTIGNGPHAGETVAYTSRQYTANSATGKISQQTMFYTLFTDDHVSYAIRGMDLDAKTYTVSGELHGVSGYETNLLNFTVTGNTANWTINPRPLTITTSSASKAYDGTALTSSGVTVTGLTDLDAGKVTVTATGTITDVGTADNTYTIDWGGVNQDNYAITKTYGKLEVTPNDGSVILTAASATKVYDGKELTANKVTASGLPSGFTFEATASGSQTEAGSSDNQITDYTIFNADHEAVTGSFSDVTLKNGTLTVTKLPVTVDLGGGTVEFDGKYHGANVTVTCDNPNLGVYFVADMWHAALPDAENGHFCFYAIHSLRMAGTTTFEIMTLQGDANFDLTFVNDTLTVTPSTSPVVVTANSATKPYDGTALSANGVSASGLPDIDLDGVTLTCTGTASGSQTDAGTSANTVTSWKIVDNYGNDWTASFGNVTTANGTLEVTPLNVEIKLTLARHEFVYGEDLYLPSEVDSMITATVTPDTACEVNAVEGGWFVNFADISIGVSYPAPYNAEAIGNGTISVSTDDIIYYDENPDNMVLSFVGDTYTVTPATLTVTTGSASKTYDSTPLTKDEASLTGLYFLDEGKITVTATGTITDAGTADNTYSIDWGDADPNNYTISENLGTLTVEPLGVEFDLNCWDTNYLYDEPTVYMHDVTGTYEGGEAVEKVSEEYTSPNTTTAIFNLTGGGKVQLVSDGHETAQVGSYTMIPAVTMLEGNAGNYNITYTDNTGTISPRRVVFYLAGGDRYDSEYNPFFTYDGVFHGSDLYVWTGLEMPDFGLTQLSSTQWRIDWCNGDQTEVTVTGGGTEPGEYPLTCTYSFTSGSAANYNIELDYTTVRIAMDDRTYTLTATSAEKTYDGTPLTGSNFTIDGSLTAWYRPEVTFSGSQTDAGSSELGFAEIHVYKELSDGSEVEVTDYVNIATVPGTLTVNPAPLTIKTPTLSKVYDSTPLEGGTATVTGLQGSDTITVTTGSLTEVGTVDNEYDIEWGTTKSSNYTVSDDPDDLGKLTVSARPITVSVGGTYTYDGMYHSGTPTVSGVEGASSSKSESTWTVTLPDGAEFSFFITGGGAHVGSSTTQLTWKQANAVADNYEITLADGTVIIEPLDLTINLDGRTVTYNSDFVSPAMPSLTITNGDHTGPVSPSSTDGDVLNQEATFTLFTGNDIKVTILNFEVIHAGTYTIEYTCTMGIPSDFNITYTGTTMTVEPAPITIHTASETKVYDGTPLPSSTDSPSLTGEIHEYIATESTVEWFSDVDSRENSGEIYWDDVSEDNYTVTEDFGTLTITPLDLLIDLGGFTGYYDGSLHITEGTGVPSLTYLNGNSDNNHTGETIAPDSYTSDGIATFSLYTGDTVTVTITGYGGETAPDDYPLTGSYTSSCSPSNFIVLYYNDKVTLLSEY
ncbi:MAG: FecR domain-containing protein [Clostridia bacterium]|nr:FecR domain-containing protein [Clostridia bacterium]